MKQFIHKRLSVSIPELSTITLNEKRYYITPEAKEYPSITTVLHIISEESIKVWRERIGDEAADTISQHACQRGTDLHAVIESYLKNETPNFPNDPRSKVRIMFNRLKPKLNFIDNILAQEIGLYSDKLTIAGRCDCIGEYKGVLSIVDFKGADKEKKEEWIQAYFQQATGYSLMFEELTGIVIEQIVILMAQEKDFGSQAFIKQRKDYIEPLKETIEKFKQANQ